MKTREARQEDRAEMKAEHAKLLESELQEAHGLKQMARDEAVKLRRDLDAKDHQHAENQAEIERLRVDLHDATMEAVEYRNKHGAAKEDYLLAINAAKAAEAKLAEAQAELSHEREEHETSEHLRGIQKEQLAAERAKTAELQAEVEAAKLATGTTGPPGETWVDALSRTESLLLAAEARTAKLVEALEPFTSGAAWDPEGAQVLKARAALAAAKASEPATGDYGSLYHDLLMSVGNKYPGETRHQTAKRYIVEREAPKGSDQRAAAKASESSGSMKHFLRDCKFGEGHAGPCEALAAAKASEEKR